MKLELIIALTLKRAAYLKTWRDFSWVVIREMTHKMTRLWRKDWQQPPEDFSSTKKTLLGLLTKEPVQKMPLGLKTQFEWLAKMSFCYMLQWEISSWRAEILILQHQEGTLSQEIVLYLTLSHQMICIRTSSNFYSLNADFTDAISFSWRLLTICQPNTFISNHFSQVMRRFLKVELVCSLR